MSKKGKSQPAWFVIIVCLVISIMGIGYYITSALSAYPDLNSLEEVTGIPSHFKERFEPKNKKVVSFQINQVKFSYVSYYPKYDAVKKLIQQKPQLTVFRYPNEINLYDVFSPFQVTTGEKVVVSHLELKKAKERNALIGLTLGLVFLIMAIILVRIK